MASYESGEKYLHNDKKDRGKFGFGREAGKDEYTGNSNKKFHGKEISTDGSKESGLNRSEGDRGRMGNEKFDMHMTESTRTNNRGNEEKYTMRGGKRR